MDNLNYPEGIPITKQESVSLVGKFPWQTAADTYDPTKSYHNFSLNGPFEQTLFLGCSIVNFNVNLGWGGENSTLTVTLVEDDGYHWRDPLSQYNTDLMRQELNRQASWQGWSTNPGVADPNPRVNTVTNNSNQTLYNDGSANYGPATKAGPTGYNTAFTPFAPGNGIYDVVAGTTTAPNLPDKQSAAKDFFKSIYAKEIALDNERKAESNALAKYGLGDFGKAFYSLGTNGAWIKKYWTKPDPGFIGHAYDILGTAVRFIFHGFEFVGLVASWKKNAGQGGYNQYTVEIKSFATLLSNTQLIIDHYGGTIFTRLQEGDSLYPAAFQKVDGLGLPSNDIGNKRGKVGSVDSVSSLLSEASRVDISKKYTGSIMQGNLANVFNIYGYIESTVGFGKHDVNELGTKIKHIYAGIQDLICFTPGYEDSGEFALGTLDSRFSPYGRIISKAPALTKLPILSPNIEEGTYNVAYLADTYKIIQPSSSLAFRVDEQAVPNAISPPYFYQILRSPSQLYQTPDYTLSDAGCIPTRAATDGFQRQHYTIDLSELPKIEDDARIKGPVISITDLIESVCSQANYDWFVDFNHINNQIKIRTISRQNQPANNYIEHLLLSAAGSTAITSYDYGKEFNDSATVRSMYIGAKQQRLLQVNSNFLSQKNNSLVFDPYGSDGNGSLLFYDIKNIVNSVRIPDHFSTRNLIHPYYSKGLYYAGLIEEEHVSSGTGAVIWEPFWQASWSNWGGYNAGKGNYLDPIVYWGPNYDSTDEKGVAEDIFTDLGYLMYNKYSYLQYDQTDNSPTLIDRTEKSDSIKKTLYNRNNYVNYPLWDEFICPYFGLDVDGNARKVYFDPGMRQIQVVCSIGDLQNILGFKLTSAISVGSGSIEESPWANPYATGRPNPEPTEPIAYNPNVPISVGQAVGSNIDNLSTFENRNMSWNLTKREFYDFESKFLITENEIRSALAGFDSWMTYTFNRDFTTDMGQIIRKTIFAQSGSLVQQKGSDVSERSRINEGRDYPIAIVFNGNNVGIGAGTESESPNSAQSDIYKGKIKTTLDGAFNFVKSLGDYYGKQYMVKVPGVSVSRSRVYATGTDMYLRLGEGEVNQVGKYEVGGEYYTNYKPSTEGAWEEVGNIIDDTILIGSITGDFFRSDDGRFGTILGFKGSYEYLTDTIDESLVQAIRPQGAAQAANINATPIIFASASGVTNHNFRTGNRNRAGELPGVIAGAFTSNTIDSSQQDTKSTVMTTAMIFATASQPATGTDIVPNDWYPSLVTSLGNEDYLYFPYGGSGVPRSSNMPSFAKMDYMKAASHRIGPDFIQHIEVPENLRYKLYTKASIEPNFVFINALGKQKKSALSNRPEGKEIRAVVTLASEVICNPVHLVDKFVGHCLQLDSALFKKEGSTIPLDLASNKPTTFVEYNTIEDNQAGYKEIIEAYRSFRPVEKDKVLQASKVESFLGTVNDGLLPSKGGFGASDSVNILRIVTDHLLKSVNSNYGSDQNKAFTMPMAPKAAMPGFAAVPLESQTAVYGPWTNQPYLLSKEIFTDDDFNNQPDALKFSTENLVGGLKVEVAEDLAPWRYGGMASLDAAVISKIQNDAAYQLQIEQGTLDIPGAPVYRLGDFLHKQASINGGPIINNISANIDSGGITTKYSFRTFSKKFSMYNKENADRLAKINTESIKRRKAIASRSAMVSNSRAQNIKRQNLNGYGNVDYVNPPMPLAWRSASELLVGHNELAIRLPKVTDSSTNPDSSLPISTVSGVISIFGYDQSWGFRPKVLVSGMDYNVVNYPKIFSQSKVMDSREAASNLSANYENTSCMSMDGLLSPISFYPTENFSTYHITKYDRELCRYCLGRGVIEYFDSSKKLSKALYPPKTDKEEEEEPAQGAPNSTGIASLNFSSQKEEEGDKKTTIVCPFCEPLLDKIDSLVASSRAGRADPPYIVATGVEGILMSGYNIQNGIVTIQTRGTVINHTTLNPIVMSHGEFSVFQNRQSGDFTGHSIKMVGVGTIPPEGPNDSLNQQTCGDNRLTKSFLEYDQLYLDKVKQLYDIPTEKRTKTINRILNSIGTDKPIPFANNSRFFGLRGPMMLHGWGYDTEGYPVPNSSGEYYYVKDKSKANKDIERAVIPLSYIDSSGDLKFVYKNQRFIYKKDLDEKVAESLDVEWLQFKGSEGSEGQEATPEYFEGEIGYFTEPYKEPTFARGWAQTPSTWPVGPIDLRWDQKAKVWTVPTTYRNVYVLLEEDLRNNIARGEIIDNNEKPATSLMALGYRKMVLVRDTYGVYTAPRSSLIYCAYDTDSGYYEPVSQNSFTTSGIIVSANTASMYRVFKRKLTNLQNNSEVVDEDTQFVSTFTNPLDIAINPGDIALFTYLPDGWIVQSARG